MTQQGFRKTDFVATTKDLVKAHGLADVTIGAYAKKGAFPFAQKGEGDKNIHRVYHKSTLTMTMGQIKENMKDSKYCDPILLIPNKTSNTKEIISRDAQLLEEISRKLSLICKELGIQ